jgi:SAM-dependent methyltransferase
MADNDSRSSVSSGQDDSYDIPYFAARNQDRDRPALWFYERIARRWIMPGTILDYGCGTGFLLRRLAKHYAVAGYDVSPHAREAARTNVSSLTVYSQEEQIPAEFFSGIVSLHVLEHIERSLLPSVLGRWYGALLPRGRVLCVVPDAAGRGHSLAGKHWTSFGDPTHVTLMGHDEWRDLFASAGFSIRRMGTDGLWCLPYREGKGKLEDGLRYSIPTLVQFLAGRLFLPAGSGESAIFLLEKV